MSDDLRTRVHTLIDMISDDRMLQKLHDLLAEESHSGVWDQLDPEQRERVLRAYDGSFDKRQLLTTEEVMKRRKG